VDLLETYGSTKDNRREMLKTPYFSSRNPPRLPGVQDHRAKPRASRQMMPTSRCLLLQEELVPNWVLN